MAVCGEGLLFALTAVHSMREALRGAGRCGQALSEGCMPADKCQQVHASRRPSCKIADSMTKKYQIP